MDSDGSKKIENEPEELRIDETFDPNLFNIELFYDIEGTATWIKTGKYKRIALQFPDEYLCHSSYVVMKLRSLISGEIFILADTSYGSCCVDEIAAEHVDADCIIHYGSACFSANSRLPVYYVFGKDIFPAKEFSELLKSQFDISKKILVFYKLEYAYIIPELKYQLKDMNNIVWTQSKFLNNQENLENKEICNQTISAPPSQDSSVFKYNNLELSEDTNLSINDEKKIFSDTEKSLEQSLIKNVEAGDGGFIDQKKSSCDSFLGFEWNLPTADTISDYIILFLGSEGARLTNLIMKFNQNCVWTYDPTIGLRKETMNVNQSLRKRFYLIEKAKSADIFGLLVGTLVVKNYLKILSYLKKIIKAAGKKHYTIVVGKLNEPKLANFSEIDIFILVACPENCLKDEKEYHKSIITPYEAEIALVKSKEWSNEYITDFNKLLERNEAQNQKTYDNSENEIKKNPDYDEDVHISLVSNSVKSISITEDHSSMNNECSNSNELTLPYKKDLIKNPEVTASTVFLKRTFQGLKESLGETVPHKAKPGLSGIAWEYKELGHDLKEKLQESEDSIEEI